MPVLAAIDIGSNAMRLAVGDVDADRHVTLRESVREPVRLGQNVFTQGQIAEETIEQAVDALRRFREAIDRHRVQLTRAVATSAIREALNQDIFVDRVYQASGIDVAVISPEEEARLIHLAVADKVPLKNKRAMLIDVGGGSTEITVVDDGNIMTTESFRLGSVRLLRLLEGKRQDERRFHRLVEEYVDATQRKIRKQIGKQRPDICIGTGGSIETLGALRGELLGKGKDTVIAADELDQLVKKLTAMTLEERIQQLRLRPDRADVIVPASIVLQKIISVAGIDEVVIPKVGLKDGLLLDMVEELYGERKQPPRAQVVVSALQLGRKYAFDETHAVTVAKYAVQLFDETMQLHNLPLDYRLLLETAALLHDIGQFVGTAEHHKHTLYLLMASPIIGLRESQMAVVANIARYHRKSVPRQQHDAYRTLASKDRVAVAKLAALLRLADAMDNEHASRVKEFSVEYRKPKFTMSLKGEGDLLLEKWALMKKAPMFEEVFSVKFAVNDA